MMDGFYKRPFSAGLSIVSFCFFRDLRVGSQFLYSYGSASTFATMIFVARNRIATPPLSSRIPIKVVLTLDRPFLIGFLRKVVIGEPLRTFEWDGCCSPISLPE